MGEGDKRKTILKELDCRRNQCQGFQEKRYILLCSVSSSSRLTNVDDEHTLYRSFDIVVIKTTTVILDDVHKINKTFNLLPYCNLLQYGNFAYL